jgi:hypothetical protein
MYIMNIKLYNTVPYLLSYCLETLWESTLDINTTKITKNIKSIKIIKNIKIIL